MNYRKEKTADGFRTTKSTRKAPGMDHAGANRGEIGGKSGAYRAA